MFTQINNLINWLDAVVWGLPLIILILFTGCLLTIRLGVLQIRHLSKALKFMIKNEDGGEGEVSSFGALCTALSATIGTGNIVGVATAIAAGGPGALFWMVIAAFLGMATKYAEGLLAIKYRTIDNEGHVLGGPFYYIENGMGHGWRWLAKIFAFFGAGVGLFGIGTFTQVNGIASAVKNFFDPNMAHTVTLFGNTYSWATVIACLVLTLCVGLVVLGGIQRISKVAQIVVPFMAVLYVALALIILITNITAVPAAIVTIVKSAFTGSALAGGAMGTMIMAMQKGIQRGIFSNESGLGSAPIAAAAAQTKEPVRQGLVSMTGTFIDTIVICSMTGLSCHHYSCFPAGSSVPSGCGIFLTDALPCILRIYNHPRLGLLWRTLSGISSEQKPDSCQNLPLAVHYLRFHRPLYDRCCRMEHCRYL